MAAGNATQSTNRVFLGGHTMRVEALGSDFWCGWSNAIDVQQFATSIMLSCWVSGEAFSGDSSFKAEVHFFNLMGSNLGSAIVWANHAGLGTDFTQYIAQVKKDMLPAGTRSIRLRFGITDGANLATGVAYVDAVQATPGEWLPAWTPSLLVEGTTLDAIADGTVYSRIKAGNLLDGDIDLAAVAIKNRGALALLDAVGAANITAGAVGPTQLTNSVSSLSKVSGGILTGSGSTATLPNGKTLDASPGSVKLKTFSAMPTVSQVADGEWFAVKAGASKGIYVRNGTSAFNGAGVDVQFS